MKAHRLCIAGIVAITIGTSSTAIAAEPPAQTVIRVTLITRADALRAAQAAMDACVAKGKHPLVLVEDANGYVWAAISDDATSINGIITSNQKAVSVLTFKASTRDLVARLKSDKQFADQYEKDPRFHFSPGAFPIYRQDKLVALIAVGGAGGVDEECALEGLKMLPWASTEPAPAAKTE